ncbi:triose-phosphate isomerase [Novosphingobium sp. 9]|uniref:triose-phosphate isomerase n=1 Tax=Novosphingobium sp. 9 TaxID=2025349 RepID=UPI0021B559C4|nr:triose-phosphate isomerase [Novosphingobium sp. 9]
MAALPYIVGNWKMNGTRAMLNELRAIDRAAGRLPRVQVAIAPPATLIFRARDAVELIGIGGQDCHALESGAFTGDVSAPMLRDAGADFTIVGHSERRTLHGESNSDVRAKAEAALSANLGVIVCVGESLDVREAGRALDVVTAQLGESLPLSEQAAEKLSVAYEPIWAIGTGKVCAASDVAEMHAALRAKLVEVYGEAGAQVRILYGGSVKADNAGELLETPEVGGALVGGASLTAESFLAIVGAAAALQD